MRTALKDSEGDGVVTGNRMGRAAHQRRYAMTERSGGVRVSELASESMSQRLRAETLPAGPTERSEGVR
jgi:hypothetical protein